MLRIALVGCGAIAPIHIRGILAAGGRVVALCDLDETRAKRLIDDFGLTDVGVFTRYDEMLDVRPDIVHICTPHYLHAPMCVAALDRNINVLCEKPLCISLDQLGDIRESAAKSTAKLGVCHQNRYEPNMKRLKKLCENGASGGMAEVVWARDEAYYNSGEWRGTWAKEGGGVLINQALHTLDLLQWVCGFPKSVTAHISTDELSSVMETEDTAMARFTTSDGRVYNFYATVGAKQNFPVLVRIILPSGEVVEAENELLVLGNKPHETPEREGALGKSEWGSGHKTLIADFYRCIRENADFAVDVEEGARVVRMILAVYRSNGKRVEIE